MENFLLPKRKKDLTVKIDLVNTEPEYKGVERENIIKENNNLLKKDIKQRIKKIKKEIESTKETEIKIKTIEKTKEKTILKKKSKRC